MLGDLNDEPQAATTQILLGPPGSEFKTAGFDRPTRATPSACGTSRRCSPRAAPSAASSTAARELIDHILVSHALAQSLESADTGTTDLPSISGPRPASDGSDHAPVFARFDRPQ